MPKGSPELTNARKEEIIKACEQLYKEVGFKDVTLKEIGKVTSFTRTSIYNYFQTKEEIFLELLKREYELWIEELQQIEDENEKLSVEKVADKIALSLEHREQLLKIMSMNMYDMEANSRMENLVDFKKMYGKSLQTMLSCIGKFFPRVGIKERQQFIYQFFPFIYGIYPYTMVTEKQKEAMKEARVDYSYQSIYEITYQCLIQLLSALEK
ncbi:MAG: TetR family transcriptional regulator [Lachnospiraceae bacterium]|nr:TetR family transcriptional regulator [Lachnospiraceae bacterium]